MPDSISIAGSCIGRNVVDKTSDSITKRRPIDDLLMATKSWSLKQERMHLRSYSEVQQEAKHLPFDVPRNKEVVIWMACYSTDK